MEDLQYGIELGLHPSELSPGRVFINTHQAGKILHNQLRIVFPESIDSSIRASLGTHLLLESGKAGIRRDCHCTMTTGITKIKMQ